MKRSRKFRKTGRRVRRRFRGGKIKRVIRRFKKKRFNRKVLSLVNR